MLESLKKIFNDHSSRTVKALQPIVAKINALEEATKALSDDQLKAKTAEFKDRLAKGESLDGVLPEAYALVREASRRTLGQRHFDVQLMGGIILNQHKIAEMRTGEGKTLVATLPAYLNALTGKGVHVVTVNDYLARRDSVWMGQIYSMLGLSVGVINHESSFLYDPAHKELDEQRDEMGSFKVFHDFLRPCSRQEAYLADITYGTNNEYGFDYLRDNIEYDPRNIRQREFNFAIIDEVDSILIDEARTPLIISAPMGESENLYETFARIADKLQPEADYEVDEKLKAISLTDSGITKAEKALGIENIYTEKGIKFVHHLETAVRAKALFSRDKQYVVRNNEVVIVDEFTGRMQPGRRWSDGLHQAVEAKEGVAIQKESRTFASITFQNYFRLYGKLAGMTGTALTSAEELLKVYGLDTVAVPTNKEIDRTDHDDLIFQNEIGKFKALAKTVKEINAKGQPILIGTVSIEKNELLSEYLKREGVPHELLNAKNHEREGEIVAQAGKKGAVTIATNMAGRGVDIKLGGAMATPAEHEEVKALGGLCVLGTERHEARRIDNQLRGRSGRQGDPGATQFFVSLEDSLMRIFAADMIKGMMGRFKIAEDEPIQTRMITRSLEAAQKKIEGFNFDARKHVLEYDDVMNHQRKGVYQRRRKLLLGGKEEVDAALDEVLIGHDDLAKIVAEKKQQVPEADFYAAIKRLFLQTIDMYWVEHLEVMEYTRSSVNLRAYGQRDPLVEYKREGLRLFREMQEAINNQIRSLLGTIGGNEALAEEERKLRAVQAQATLIGGSPNAGEGVAAQGTAASSMPAASIAASAARNADGEKIGRNDPCPCGSGKKYKACGALNTEEHKRLAGQKAA